MTSTTEGHSAHQPVRHYDRVFLLSAKKRNEVLELWEVQRYGLDSFADPEYVHIYGMPPAEWYGRGVRLLARTTVECVRDALGEAIGQDVADILWHAPAAAAGCTVIDPFAGSCNSLYWILQHLHGARGIACELDPTIFAMTKANIAALDTPIDLFFGDYRSLLPACLVPPNHLLVVFVAPPWGDALDAATGLDLRRTQPPVASVVEEIDQMHQDKPILYVTQVFQHLEPTSLADLESRFEWAQLRIYDINLEGMKHGVLLGSRRWTPADSGKPDAG
jgi:predicted RNA methylase